jgi:small subunit ribosomal protein S20
MLKFHTLKYLRKEYVDLPNIKSAEKRVVLSEKQNKRNRQVISTLKTKIKEFEGAVENNSDNKQQLFVEATGLVDKAASKGVIHKNNANRKKSQLAKKLQAN